MLSVEWNKLDIKSCIYNASGPRCTTSTDLDKLNVSKSGMVLTKSTTLEYREGNPKPRYWDDDNGSINSMGLPNNGIDYYLDFIEGKYNTKPYFISVSGLSLEENISILGKIFHHNDTKISGKVDGIEINLSCPNIVGKGQLAYDFNELDVFLTKIFEFLATWNSRKNILIGFKLPPYFDIEQFNQVSDILIKYDIDFITCVNSIGNGLIIDWKNESTVIKPKEGLGGIGGVFIKPTGLANVNMFYKLFKKKNSNIKVIGCGGIQTGIDAFEYILCGAHMVQIGTQYQREDVGVFDRMEKELKEIMKNKKYKKLIDFRGKLKVTN